MSHLIWAYLLISNLGFALGTVFLKRFADTGSLWAIGTSFAFFACANLAYAKVLAHGLSQGAALSSTTSLILMTVAGAVLFEERLNETQLAALALSLISIWLFSISARGTA